jgi:hypothetical protein
MWHDQCMSYGDTCVELIQPREESGNERKICFGHVALAVTAPAWAPDLDPTPTVPEPSTLALFAAAAIAIMIARKFKK